MKTSVTRYAIFPVSDCSVRSPKEHKLLLLPLVPNVNHMVKTFLSKTVYILAAGRN